MLVHQSIFVAVVEILLYICVSNCQGTNDYIYCILYIYFLQLLSVNIVYNNPFNPNICGGL